MVNVVNHVDDFWSYFPVETELKSSVDSSNASDAEDHVLEELGKLLILPMKDEEQKSTEEVREITSD